MKSKTKKLLAASVLAGGMIFSGGVNAANVVADSSFEHTPGGFKGENDITTVWGKYRPYAHTYRGVSGPDLNLVSSVQYGYYGNITMKAGKTYMGVEEEDGSHTLRQTVSLVSPDVTLEQIAKGEGRFCFSAWLQTCCDDEHGLYLTFNDAAHTQILFDLTKKKHQVTTADKVVNPGGSQNKVSETDKKYWKLYEVKGMIPPDATKATIEIKSAPGQDIKNGGDFGTDLVILDTVAGSGPVVNVKPPFSALLGLGGFTLILEPSK